MRLFTLEHSQAGYRADNAWLRQRKLWHALHHRTAKQACFSVTNGFWDHVFGSARQPTRPVRP